METNVPFDIISFCEFITHLHTEIQFCGLLQSIFALVRDVLAGFC